MTNGRHDKDPAMGAMEGYELLKKLGIPSDQMIDSATLEVIGSGFIKLNVGYILSIGQLKQIGIDLNA